jgi:hypothetical protein
MPRLVMLKLIRAFQIITKETRPWPSEKSDSDITEMLEDNEHPPYPTKEGHHIKTKLWKLLEAGCWCVDPLKRWPAYSIGKGLEDARSEY